MYNFELNAFHLLLAMAGLASIIALAGTRLKHMRQRRGLGDCPHCIDCLERHGDRAPGAWLSAGPACGNR